MQTGTPLGHYTILSAIGKGGMGEVWKAKDTKLGRDVAIKTLPEEFAKDAERLARFEREAKLLASLNHPNIAAIYGFEEDNGQHFLVLELVEGDTLADQIKRGAIPVEASLKLALQIAEALEAAHEKGVIHRDLKPANIKVTPEGQVKVLDFGLAKAFEGEQADVSGSNSPTLSMAATQQGIILGTAAYMSPEQARGENADQRVDVWAFGVVLFGMLTGRGTFDGRTVSDVLAAVLAKDPDWNSLPHNLHAQLRRLLERCLSKELKDRYHGIADARVDIESVLADPDGVIVQSVAQVVQASPPRLHVVAAIALAAMVAGVTAWTLKPTDTRLLSRFSYDLPEGLALTILFGRPSLAISPNGEQFVFNAGSVSAGSEAGLYVRSMDELEARFIAGAENPENPVFSPDGEEIAYYQRAATGRLMKIAVSGGAPVTLAEPIENPFGMSWESQGTILIGQSDGIWSVSESGGEPNHLIVTGPGEQAHGPQLLPGGEWVLFTLTSATGDSRWDEADIVIESLSSAERRVLRQGGSDARYVPTGHLVYAFGDALFASPFDVDSLEFSGGPASIIQGVRRPFALGLQTGVAFYGFSDDGTLVYLTAPPSDGVSTFLVTLDRIGNPQPLTGEARNYTRPRISPDGSRVAVEVTEGGRATPATHIWIVDIETGNGTQLTFEGSQNEFPVWAPDSQTFVFRSDRSGRMALYTKSADGSGEAELVFEGSDTLVATDVLPDGTLLLQDSTDGDNDDIWTLRLVGDGSPSEFLATPANERSARFSPDGRWIAYASDESGQFEVYVRPYPSSNGGQRRVSEGGFGNYAPVWSPNGGELYYVVGPPEILMSVPIQTDLNLLPGRPQELFPIDGAFQADARTTIVPLWDLTPDGTQFVFVQAPGGGGKPRPTHSDQHRPQLV